jgi:hypothetical protein
MATELIAVLVLVGIDMLTTHVPHFKSSPLALLAVTSAGPIAAGAGRAQRGRIRPPPAGAGPLLRAQRTTLR